MYASKGNFVLVLSRLPNNVVIKQVSRGDSSNIEKWGGGGVKKDDYEALYN